MPSGSYPIAFRSVWKDAHGPLWFLNSCSIESPIGPAFPRGHAAASEVTRQAWPPRRSGAREPQSLFTHSRFFSEKEPVDLTLAVVAIDGWNRLNIAFHTPAGSYQPGQRAESRPRSRAPQAESSH